MKHFIAFLLVVCCASNAYAFGGSKVRFGIFGTTVKAPCGANVCASPCGAKISYGGGGYGYGGGGCNSGYCGPVATPYSGCSGGGCASPCQTCPTPCATCPQQCNTCPQQYGVRTHTNVCTDSYLPPDQAVQTQFVQPQQQQIRVLPDQLQYNGGPRVVYVAY